MDRVTQIPQIALSVSHLDMDVAIPRGRLPRVAARAAFTIFMATNSQ